MEHHVFEGGGTLIPSNQVVPGELGGYKHIQQKAAEEVIKGSLSQISTTIPVEWCVPGDSTPFCSVYSHERIGAIDISHAEIANFSGQMAYCEVKIEELYSYIYFIE